MAEELKPAALELAQQLSEGFVALSEEYQQLFQQQRQLENKISFAKRQYLELLKRFTPDSVAQDHIAFLHDLERVGSEQPGPPPPLVEQLSRSVDDAERRDRLIRNAQLAAESLRSPGDSGVKIWSGPAADKDQSPVEMPQLEKDFTVAGTPSKLGCPFAQGSRRQSPLATPRSSRHGSLSRGSARGRRSKRPSFTDPIRAEICGNAGGAPTESIEGSASAAVCPIRFLNQHDPEEVAKYFEIHKHDLPRSHEVCIKRFQGNAESVQQLDRKYGNLVSMIQGLGQKHQEFLPPEPEEDEEEVEAGSKQDNRVHDWAEAVSASREHFTPDKEEESADNAMDEDETRTSHFDRPMKEVRVGESPSRPWGISIPVKYAEGAGSSSSVGSAPTASPRIPLETQPPVEEEAQKPSKCPFDHRAFAKAPETKSNMNAGPSEPTHPLPPLPPHSPPQSYPPQPEARPQKPDPTPRTEHIKTDDATPKTTPQMIFNGPVFIGYPPDQLLMLLQNSNFGGLGR